MVNWENGPLPQYIKILIYKSKGFWLTKGLWRPDWDRISKHFDLGFAGCGNSPQGSTLRFRSASFGGSDTETGAAGNIALGLCKEHDLRFKAMLSDSATFFLAWPAYIN